MKPFSRLLTCLITVGLLTACHPALPPVVTGPTPTPEQREMATLSFLAYIGDALEGTDEWVETQLDQCMKEAIRRQGGLDRWELAWGPAVYHFSLGKLDDNMMYVVRDKADPAHLAVVVRGTNLDSALDWLVEDFDVVHQVSWPGGKGPAGAKTSKAISEGLQILRSMEPAGGPAPNQTVTAFLQEQAGKYPHGIRLDVTGHSLGGALSPMLALLLSETLTGEVKISVFPLAGPTPGNGELAAYYQSVLGTSTHRFWNPYDVVPQAWSYETFGEAADLYEPLTRANPVERGLLDGLRTLVKDKDYTQLSTPSKLTGAVTATPFGKKADWFTEAGWQHHCGYQCAFGISVLTSVPQCQSKRPIYPCPPQDCPEVFRK